MFFFTNLGSTCYYIYSNTNTTLYCRVGTLGKDIKSFIDTRKAGPGELSLVNAYELTKLIV